MKKYAKLFLTLTAFTVLLLAFGEAKTAKAAGTADGLTYSIYSETAMISVESTGNVPVYYQIIKEASPASLKATGWLPTAAYTHQVSVNSVSKTKYEHLIDISALSKTSYIAVTTNPNATAPSDCKIIELKYSVKDVKYTLDYNVEDAPNVYSIFNTLVVNGIDGSKLVDYDKNSTETAQKFATMRDMITLYWRRNADCEWAYDSSDSAIEVTNIGSEFVSFTNTYSMLRASGGTLYIKVHGTNHGDSPDYGTIVMPSKEAKIKIPKTAAAPTIKIDYAKGSIAIKNGMEFTCEGIGGAFYVPAYGKDVEDNSDRLSLSSYETSSKVSCLYAWEIVNFIDYLVSTTGGSSEDILEPGETVVLNIRTSATAKKYASWYTTISFKVPKAPVEPASATAGATCGTYVYDKYNKTLKLTFTVQEVEGATLEYAIIPAGSGETNVKYTKVEDLSETIDLSKNVGKTIKYKDSTGVTKNVPYEDCEVIFRWAAVIDKDNPENNEFAGFGGEGILCTQPTYKAVTVSKATTTNGSFELKDAAGKTALSAEAVDVSVGSDYSFTVVPQAETNYVVDKVTYTVNGGAAVTVSQTNKKYVVSLKNVSSVSSVVVTVTFKEK